MNILLGLVQFIIQNAESLIGIPMVLLVDYLNKDVHSERERFFVSVIACLFAAIILNANEILYGSPEQVLASATLIFAESQAVFKLYFKNSWLRWKILDLYGTDEKSGVETTTEPKINGVTEVIPVTE